MGRMASWDSRLHRHESRAQDADRVAAHRGADLVVGEAGVDQRLRHLRQMRGVEAHRRRAVIVAAERDMVGADEGADMLPRNRSRGGLGKSVALDFVVWGCRHWKQNKNY